MTYKNYSPNLKEGNLPNICFPRRVGGWYEIGEIYK